MVKRKNRRSTLLQYLYLLAICGNSAVGGREFALWIQYRHPIDLVIGLLNLVGVIAGIYLFATTLTKGDKHGTNRGTTADHSNSSTIDTVAAALRAASEGGTSSRKSPSIENLSVVSQQDPIVTWKRACLKLTERGIKLTKMLPVSCMEVIPDAEAICLLHPVEHKPPVLNCSCGFYAYNEKPEELYHYAILQVELSGVIIEHETGYRAQYQRVLGCFMPHKCAQGFCEGFFCNNLATTLVASPSYGGAIAIVSSCGNHEAKRRKISLSEVSNAIGIEVQWDTDR